MQNKKMQIPLLFENKAECCGCLACMAICSKNAITMERDIEGFEYPVVNEESCVRCYLCLKVCPLKKG